MAGCGHECLLAGPEEEDRRSQGTRYAHRRCRQDLRRGRLDRQTLRRRGARGKIARPEEAPRVEAQAGRSGKEAAGSGSAGATGGDAAGEARVPATGGRRGGQRLHGKQDAQAARVEPKKRSVGASERDEFLRAAWRVMVAGSIEPERLVFVDEMGANTSLTSLCAWSRRGERAPCSAPRNWGANVTLLASMTLSGMGPCLAVEGPTTKAVFETYVEWVLAPSLQPGQVGGDGQPFLPQRTSGARARRGAGVRAFVPARLLA